MIASAQVKPGDLRTSSVDHNSPQRADQLRRDGTQDRTLRTFVAESGFVLASFQYGTVLDSAGYCHSLTDIKSAICGVDAIANRERTLHC